MGVVVITGCREFDDYALLSRVLSEHLKPGDVIRHGKARTGADHLADLFADENGFEKDPMPADWKRFDLGAGSVRNEEMMRKEPVPEKCIAFWNKYCSGTDDAIRKARKAGINVVIINISLTEKQIADRRAKRKRRKE